MHAPEDRGDVPDDLLLMMEKDATNSDLVQDYRWMYSIALLRTPVGRVGEDLQEVWWMFSLPFLDTTSNGEGGYYYR